MYMLFCMHILDTQIFFTCIQAICNVEVALSCLAQYMPIPMRTAEAVVDETDHCEKTLELLWNIIFHYR